MDQEHTSYTTVLISLHSDALRLIFSRLDHCSKLATRFTCRLLHRLIAAVPEIRGKHFCYLAASLGYLELLIWARQRGALWDEYTCSTAAKSGHLQILKWAHENGCPWNEWTCYFAAFEGHLQLLKWARQNGCPWNHMVCEVASQEGHIEVLQWARKNGCTSNDDIPFW